MAARRSLSADSSLLPPGQPVDLDNCAREPIHLPGGIQRRGVIVVARANDRRIVQTSENAAELLPVGAAALLGKTLDHLVGAPAAERLVDAALDAGGPAVRADRVTVAGGGVLEAHSFSPAPGLVGVDLEPAYAQPLDASQVVGRVAGFGRALAAEPSTDGVIRMAVAALGRLTGFDRTWAYRFESDGHGVVVAEEHAPELESFLGLHFPESDIPSQARDLYLRHGVRVIHDAAEAVAPLVPLENPETGSWLDLSASGLRAVSPMHIRYLTNMGVRSSMSVPLVVAGELWGLLSAHHYGRPADIPIRMRAECELLGVMTSMQLATMIELEQTRHRAHRQVAVSRVAEVASVSEAISEGLTADEGALLGVCNAAGCIIAIGHERRTVGSVPELHDVERLLDALASAGDDLVATDAVGDVFPELADLATTVSGVLAFPLSRRQGNWIVWVRPETVAEVTWANRDKELARRDPSGALDLGPRESFERWVEQVHGRSLVWEPGEIEAARELRSALGSLLIARTERLAKLNEELARSNDELDAFAYAAAHDLREPVRGVEQLADFLLEDHGEALGADGRAQVETIQRLADRMDSLLGSLLTYAELGETAWSRTRLHLPTIVAEARELLGSTVPAASVIEVQDVWVDADEAGVRQLLLNLIWNAVKYSDGDPVIRIGTRTLSEAEGDQARVRRSLVADDEPLAIFVEDEGIGIAPEHHQSVFNLFRRLHAKHEYGGGNGAGLTLCRRIVERHGGVIWIDSSPGRGTRFWFTLAPA